LLYGRLDDHTHILVYTSTPFMKRIKRSPLFNAKIKFEINDTYDNVTKACTARLDLFNLRSVHLYKQILYLDTDILVKDDINKVFEVCKDDILYVLQEGSIDRNTRNDFWGKTLFGDELHQYSDKSAFTSGILLFNNCERMQFLFEKINEDIQIRRHKFHDQPHIIYNAFKYGLYDNKTLNALAVNRDGNINSTKVIHHFPGGPGNSGKKMGQMSHFLTNLKEKFPERKLLLPGPKIKMSF
jgi:hypothetical protein